MANYIMDLRRLVGNRPIMMCCAGVIIFDKSNRILLQLRSDNNCWGIPGGAVELGETIAETAKREVFEETGLIIENHKLFNVYSGKEFHYIYPNGDEVYLVDNIFIATEYSGELKPDEVETKRAMFFELDKLPEEIHTPNRLILKDIISKYKV